MNGWGGQKRVVDLVIAVPVLVITLPLQAVVGLVILLRLGRPVIFRQIRLGLNGEPFELTKFRTMLPLNPVQGMIDDHSRMTPLGSWLRASSLDELPTLWNVILGHMSMVGPRPLLVKYAARYTPQQARRHEVRPGLTGLVQISGRNGLSWEEKFRMDVNYVVNHSFLGDLKILGSTLFHLLKRDGITASGEATTSEFLGSGVPTEPK